MINLNNLSNLDVDSVRTSLAGASATAKHIVAITNSIIFTSMSNAVDKLAQHPSYRHNVKRLFKEAKEAQRKWESNLLHAQHFNLFHVSDMPESMRRKYRDDFTDRDFFDMWLNLGAYSYDRYKVQLEVLRNKYKVFFEQHHISHPVILSYVLTCEASFTIADTLLRTFYRNSSAESGLGIKVYEITFSDLSHANVSTKWSLAINELLRAAHIPDISPTDIEDKNFSHALVALEEAIIQDILSMGSLSDSIEDNVEYYRTKGMMKKELRNVSELRSKVEDNLTAK